MMSKETVRLTREELYDLVWSRPMTAIAGEFGMSSVALAKHVKKLNIPRPSRGHWQQVAAGQKSTRDALPAAGPDVPAYVILRKHPPHPARRRAPTQGRPSVHIPERVRAVHPIASELAAHLGPSAHHRGGLLVVKGPWHPVLRVAPGTKQRAIRILHALFAALDSHGHRVSLAVEQRDRGERFKRFRLQVSAGGGIVEMFVTEHLNQVEARKQKWAFLQRKIELAPSGLLTLSLEIPWPTPAARTRWRDRDDHRLEEDLGEVVWVVEEAANAWEVHRQEQEEAARCAELARVAAEEERLERERRAALERQRHEDEARMVAYKKSLVEDLVKMATAWRTAETVRAFVARAETALGASPVDTAAEWLAWAKAEAEALDPLCDPRRIPKPLVALE